ncbi:MAG: ATP-binding protein [Hyphomicrobiales bacterium]|jgi:two-component system C4-dicarboxylate transport sensor histidine kinase DctB
MADISSGQRFLKSDSGRLTLGLLVVIALGLAALPSVERLFLVRAGDQGMATLRLSVEGLRGALQRFEPLPSLIGERRILAQLLADPQNSVLQGEVNEQLRVTADELGASDVYLLDADGLTIAASNYLKERPFIGRSFAFRPYFTQAIAGGLGRYFALGTTSLERGYFYAAPVMDGGEIVGTLTLKFTVDAFENAWRGGTSDIIVSDLNDIVFMASREVWHFRTLSDLSPAVLAEVADTQQYPLEELTPLTNSREPLTDVLSVLRVQDEGVSEDFVTASTLIEDVGWRVAILVPAGPAKAQALTVLLVFVLFVLFVGLALMSLLQRRARILERMEAQRAAQDLLERRVEERTADLNAANANLLVEVDERRAAEQRLRKTQHELVQAGKLAALGQMSAALSHEINQPLAAVKTYADNAVTFLDRNRPSDARENVSRISKMADRMAAISGHLRNFARRPQEGVGPVNVLSAIDDAIALMEARFKKTGTEIAYVRPENPLWVMGGQLRLQQVIINLLNNALDSMEAQPYPSLEIAIEAHDGTHVLIHVRDSGGGLDERALTQLFDPFFTTKSPGKGLGLGLSISYNIVEDFGGRLRARNRTQGGAEFSIELRAAEAPASHGLAAE